MRAGRAARSADRVGTRALLVACALASSAACGSRSAAGGPWPGRTHTRGRPGPPPMSAAAAMVELDRALADRRDADAVIYANRLASAGGAVSRPERVRAAIDRLAEEELSALWPKLDPQAAPAGAVALRLALLRRHRGDDDGALQWLARAKGAPDFADRAAKLRRAIERRREVDPAVVAVLLPLSGRFGALGEAMKAAVSLAAAEDPDLRVEYLDTAGDPATAVAAVERAVERYHAVAILGPVGAEVSRAAAARAVELGVPIGLLSPEEDGASPAAGVFRLWTSAEWEAREAARIAVELGYDALAVFAPRDERGEAQREAFSEAAVAAGVRVVASESYDPTGTDLEPDVKRLLGLDPMKNARLRRYLRRHGRKGLKTFSPDVAFDLLYVPDSYERAALVASYLPYFNVEVRRAELMDTLSLRKKHGGRLPSIVQLLGSSGWHEPGLFPRGGEAVSGALVLDVFGGGASDEYSSDLAAEFASRFEHAAGRPPGRVAAEAYDAASLLFAARRRAPLRGAREPRREMARALRGAQLREGACGPARVNERGQLVREAIVWRVDRGDFVLHGY